MEVVISEFDEAHTREKLSAILARLQESPTYTETRFTNGDGFIEHHINWIKNASKKQPSGEAWNTDLAKFRLQQIEFPPDMTSTVN